MSKCDSCIYSKVGFDIREWPCVNCLQGYRYEPRPQTNADRIRNMTDEELARYMAEVQLKNGCPQIGAWHCRESCTVCWLDWLKQEADDKQ